MNLEFGLLAMILRWIRAPKISRGRLRICFFATPDVRAALLFPCAKEFPVRRVLAVAAVTQRRCFWLSITLPAHRFHQSDWKSWPHVLDRMFRSLFGVRRLWLAGAVSCLNPVHQFFPPCICCCSNLRSVLQPHGRMLIGRQAFPARRHGLRRNHGTAAKFLTISSRRCLPAI